ncbi:hypothetical protein AB0A63_35805 [Lentzea sp. NPDC042327]|uniref:hypothetical protein n=1 Tax=Lentzea sp. NPDC042327 TaxID=3154801 RepID=UPI00340EA124
MSFDARVAAHGAVSTALAGLGDEELAALVAAARPLGAGIGGTSALLHVDGVPVFVKRVPLTELELRPEHVRSTANLFGLPAFCHYGVGLVGAPGFGAWRELAVHELTTDWVLAGDHEGFPLLHHWRVLPHLGQSLPDELADVDGAVAYWEDTPAARHRIEALRDSTASIALFLEHFPHDLHDWLRQQVRAGAEATANACAMVERELAAGIAAMNARGLLHLDAHFRNVLTDGERLYFADFGLALTADFDLARDEADFFAGHQGFDRDYAATHLVLWLTAELYGHRGAEHSAFLRACARGERPAGVPRQVADVLVRHAPTAELMTGFYRRFQQESRHVPYPAATRVVPCRCPTCS